MATGPRRSGFYLSVLVAGFVVGGFLTALCQRFLPDGAPKTLFTTTATPTIGPFSMDLLVVTFTLGPVGLHVSVLGLIGVFIAYLIAKSLF